MTEQEYVRIQTFLKNKYGIDMTGKKQIMQGRMENYIITHGFVDFSDYMNTLEKDVTGRWERELVNMLSTNHTYFMREFEHFDFLKTQILPELRIKEEKTKDLRIWCAAASTGQEPYMLAMLMTDFFGLVHNEWDTTILATDISTQALTQAVAGIYDESQIETLPDVWKRRFLKPMPDGRNFSVTKQIKDQVLFRTFNLMEQFPFKRKMHIIFLRNVMIYFDKKTKNELVKKVYDILEPGGYLFIGRTETIDKNIVPFEMIQPSIFRKGRV